MTNMIFAQQGWQCPICLRVYAPMTGMCYYCPPKLTTSAMTDEGRRIARGSTAEPHTAPKPEVEERDAAWDKCRADREPVTGSDDWTVGEVGNYRGFFNLGWAAALLRAGKGE